jgi:hypothetical protein
MPSRPASRFHAPFAASGQLNAVKLGYAGQAVLCGAWEADAVAVAGASSIETAFLSILPLHMQRE